MSQSSQTANSKYLHMLGPIPRSSAAIRCSKSELTTGGSTSSGARRSGSPKTGPASSQQTALGRLMTSPTSESKRRSSTDRYRAFMERKTSDRKEVTGSEKI